MKRIYSLLMLLMLLSARPALAQQALFSKWDNTKNVSTVYISKHLLALVPKNGSGVTSGFAKVAAKVDQLRILNTSNRKTADAIAKEALAYYRKNAYEMVMKANDESDGMTIYQHPLGGGRTEFVLFAREGDGEVFSIIDVEGTLSLSDLQEITGGA